MSLAYTRKFIILKKEFSNLGGNPKGHCKLEIKGLRGIVTVNIENAEKDTAYNVVFILNSNNNNNIWNLGKIFTDESGKGKGEYVFLQRDLEKENLLLEKVSGILIVRDGKVLLGGYLDKEDGTIQRYIDKMPFNPIIESKEEPVEAVKVEKEQIDEVEEVKDIQEVEEVEEIKEIEVMEVHDTGEEMDNEVVEQEYDSIYDVPSKEPEYDSMYDVPAKEQEYDPMYDIPAKEQEYDPIYDVPAKEQEYDPIYDVPAKEQEYNPEYDIPAKEPKEETLATAVESEEIEEIEIEKKEIQEKEIEENQDESVLELEEDPEDDFEPDYKTLDYIKKLNQKNQTTNYVLSILRFFPYIEPFKYNLKDYNWWIVELDKDNEYRAFLPYFSYIVGGNNKEAYKESIATCNELMDKYGHYLFGLYNEGENVKYFVYGIPGKFVKEEHPYAGERGFNTWYEGESGEGYWIIHIDPMTGKPVESPIPMIPID
ncbi:hypothetical protein [Tissierella pigra]|uniref:Uncharacterized protein n=1 Tax=Tissierella pigra TaxID=2607614 RepID=A0A6N7XVK6_9FIRM|nr:hypothetical protein [Tissierella pigra]MSU00574.1 hypothetical protein [Tissierella pigra]